MDERCLEQQICHCDKHGEYTSYLFKIRRCVAINKDSDIYDFAWSPCEKCVEEYEKQYCEGTLQIERFKSCGAGKGEIERAGYENIRTVTLRQAQLKAAIFDDEKSFCKQIAKGKGLTLVFLGDTGTGKSFFALSMLKQWYNEVAETKMIQNMNVTKYQWGKFITSDDLCDDLANRNAYNGGMTKKKAEQYYIDEVPLLIIDEVGRTINNNNERDVLFRIITGRQSDNKPTIITTNYSLDQISKQLGAALVSRINSMGAFVPFNDIPDMRQQLIQGD